MWASATSFIIPTIIILTIWTLIACHMMKDTNSSMYSDEWQK